MVFKKTILVSVIALMGLGGTACGSDGASSAASSQVAANTNPEHKTSHVHGQTSKTKAHQRYLKPGAGISYEHNLPANIASGETVIFQLTLDESYDAGNMNVSISSEGGVQVFPTSSYATFDMSTARQHVMDVSVTVESNGRHYLNVRAEADNGSGQSIPRIFSIAVQSGKVEKMTPHRKLLKTPAGENIIAMDAEEVIQ